MGETQTGQVQTPEPKALTIPVNVAIEAAEVVLAQPEMEELLQGAELILHPTVANDRRDICAVRCKENALPMVISVYQNSSYCFNTWV